MDGTDVICRWFFRSGFLFPITLVEILGGELVPFIAVLSFW